MCQPELLALAISGLTDLALAQHWASDGRQPQPSMRSPSCVLRLLLGARPPGREPMTTETADVVIVGAGPTGLAARRAASALRRHGRGSSTAARPRARVARAGDATAHARAPAQAGDRADADRARQRRRPASPASRQAGRRDAALRHRARRHRLPVPALHLAGRDRGGPERAPRRPRRPRRTGRRAARVHDRRRRGHVHAPPPRRHTRAGTHPLPDRLRRCSQHRPARGRNRLRGRRLPADVRARRPRGRRRARAATPPRLPRRRGMLFFFPLGTPATWRMQGMRPPPAPADDGEPRRASPRSRSCRRSATASPAAPCACAIRSGRPTSASSIARPRATGPAASSSPATPPTSTAPPAPRA